MEIHNKVIEEDIEKLNKACKQLESINVIDYNSIKMKKIMQGKLNNGFSLLIDVKMDLEKILKEVQEKWN